MAQKPDHPIMGKCDKCATDNSELFEYRDNYWICKANVCWDEETERDSGKHFVDEDRLDDYRKLVQGTK